MCHYDFLLFPCVHFFLIFRGREGFPTYPPSKNNKKRHKKKESEEEREKKKGKKRKNKNKNKIKKENKKETNNKEKKETQELAKGKRIISLKISSRFRHYVVQNTEINLILMPQQTRRAQLDELRAAIARM